MRGIRGCAPGVAISFCSNPCPAGSLLRRSGEAGTDSSFPQASPLPQGGAWSWAVPSRCRGHGPCSQGCGEGCRQPLSWDSASESPWAPGRGDALAPPAHAGARAHVIRHNDTWWELPASPAVMTHRLPAHLRGHKALIRSGANRWGSQGVREQGENPGLGAHQPVCQVQFSYYLTGRLWARLTRRDFKRDGEQRS